MHRDPSQTSSPAFRRGLATAALLVGLLAGPPVTVAFAADEPAPNADPAASTSPAAADDIRFAASPATTEGRDGRTRFSYTLDPGQKVSDYLAVSNLGTTAETFDVYAADAFTTEEGQFALATTDEAATGASLWFDLGGGPGADGQAAHAQVTIEAGGTQIVPFTVGAPADATPGDHPAGLVVSRATTEGTVLLEHRVATRAYLRVSGPLQPAITVGGLRADYWRVANPLAGTVHLAYTLSNSGNVALEGRLSVWVDSTFGPRVASIAPAEVGEILPGETRALTVDVTGVPQAGPLVLHARLDPFVDPNSDLDPGPISSSERELRLVAVPWVGIGVLVGLVALVVLAIWRGRRRKARHVAELRRAREEGALAAQAAAASDGQVATGVQEVQP